MLHFFLLLLLIQFIGQVIPIDVSTVTTNTEKKNQNRVISVHSACSRQALMALFVLKDPFNGRLYARGYPDDCKVKGNGSREISITVMVSQCGAKIIEKEDGTLKYELYLYVQYDRHVQQSTDHLVQVECVPEELFVNGRLATGVNKVDEGQPYPTVETIPATQASPLTVDCWMEILRGKMPTVEPITGHVDVGDDLTMMIKIKHADGIMAKVTNCIASDGSKESQQELIDSNGCSIDLDVMPQLQEQHDATTGIKLAFASFQAFKFPERENLHLHCRVLICNNTCPLETCSNSDKWGFRRRMSREFYSLTGNVLRQMDVFNSVEVKSPLDESTNHYVPNPQRTAAAMASSSSTKPEDMFCLNSTRMIIIIGVLLGVLLISLIVTICMCVRARELRRRLLQRQSFPYGRVHEYS